MYLQKVISKKTFKKNFLLQSWRSLTKKAGSGSESGSVPKFYGSQHWIWFDTAELCLCVACLAAQEDLPHDPVDAGAHVVPLDHLEKQKTWNKKPRKRMDHRVGWELEWWCHVWRGSVSDPDSLNPEPCCLVKSGSGSRSRLWWRKIQKFPVKFFFPFMIKKCHIFILRPPWRALKL